MLDPVAGRERIIIGKAHLRGARRSAPAGGSSPMAHRNFSDGSPGIEPILADESQLDLLG
jgi:hypothetical protein